MTDRIPLAQHTKASLDQLYEDLGRAEAELRRYAEADSADAAAGSYALRAERVEARLARVTALCEQWVKAGPPPLGVSVARWWDARLVELHAAIRPPADESERTTPDNPPTSSHWTPPPPGDRREQLPDHLLALLDIPPYTSTACETAELLAAAIARHPEHADELRQWEQRQRQRCRINNKYTGVNCQHLEAEDAIPPA